MLCWSIYSIRLWKGGAEAVLLGGSLWEPHGEGAGPPPPPALSQALQEEEEGQSGFESPMHLK